MLDQAGFVQRDIKGDNILIGKDGGGILADFGLCIATGDSGLPEFLGDGTVEYSAPEIVNKLSGSNLCTEIYSLFVVFVESVMMRHPFGVAVSNLTNIRELVDRRLVSFFSLLTFWPRNWARSVSSV